MYLQALPLLPLSAVLTKPQRATEDIQRGSAVPNPAWPNCRHAHYCGVPGVRRHILSGEGKHVICSNCFGGRYNTVIIAIINFDAQLSECHHRLWCIERPLHHRSPYPLSIWCRVLNTPGFGTSVENGEAIRGWVGQPLAPSHGQVVPILLFGRTLGIIGYQSHGKGCQQQPWRAKKFREAFFLSVLFV